MKFVKSLIVAGVYIFLTLFVMGAAGYATGRLPDRWNPLAPLDINERPQIFENWKIHRALASPEACKAALATGRVVFRPEADFVAADNPKCGIEGRVNLQNIAGASMVPLETSCEAALRMAIWVSWDLQELAREEMGAEITAIDHFGSYNCRRIRTSRGPSERMSKHATAEAIDISGFRFANGRSLSLIRDWEGEAGRFLKDARDSACNRFTMVLSPDYNSLHADHFHMESSGWGRCS